MKNPVKLSFLNLLEYGRLSDTEIRRLVGWQASVLVDLLQRKCITVRYAEQMLFNLDIVQKLEQLRLADCVEVVDWGMQLEDWDEHTLEQLPEALATLAQLAQRLLEGAENRGRTQPKRDRKASTMKQAKSRREGPVEIHPGTFAARQV